MKLHALSELTPLMADDEFEQLRADIKQNGLLYPIVIFEGKVLDGRHRLRACQELAIKPSTTAFEGDAAAAKAFVLSSNVHRRHLSREQKRAFIVAELKANPQQSDRAIAKKARVDHKTVSTVRESASSNGEIPHKPRHEASGRKARGRKPKSAAVTKPKDLDAARILREIEKITPKDLSDPYSFGGSLFIASKRFAIKLELRRG